VQSQKLAELLRNQRELIKSALAKKTGGMNLLDVYLASGEVPPSLADDLNGDDALSELYRLDRGYVPADIRAEPKQTDLETLLNRFNALLAYAQSEPIKSNPTFRELGERLKERIGEITTARKQLLEVEKDMMLELAASLRAQTLDGGAPS
jgi:SpoVK/Ycf46/Vps4 family AAA+-type ATPase